MSLCWINAACLFWDFVKKLQMDADTQDSPIQNPTTCEIWSKPPRLPLSYAAG